MSTKLAQTEDLIKLTHSYEVARLRKAGVGSTETRQKDYQAGVQARLVLPPEPRGSRLDAPSPLTYSYSYLSSHWL
jgi:hypothetical protein